MWVKRFLTVAGNFQYNIFQLGNFVILNGVHVRHFIFIMCISMQSGNKLLYQCRFLLVHASRVIKLFSEEIRSPLIMFRATGPSTAHIGETLIFSIPMENFGDGYNADTGVFTAPIKGLYMFSLSMCTLDNKDARFGIKTDGSIIAAKRIIDDKRYSCGTIVTPIVLNRLQPVHAECLEVCIVVLNTFGLSMNLFTGSLIHSLE